MTSRRKPSPLEAFESNIADAESLVSFAVAFRNERSRGMRAELRDRVGDAIKVPAKERGALDCIESDDLFMVFKPKSALSRADFEDLRPLLRQAIVAGCAALETYVADKAMAFVGPALRADPPPDRLRSLALTVGDWVDINASYERRAWGIRQIIEERIRELSSTAPSQIGVVLSAIGQSGWEKGVDSARGRAKGTTQAELKKLTDRRNKIAHVGDREGRGRAALTTADVEEHLRVIREVVAALETVLKNHKP